MFRRNSAVVIIFWLIELNSCSSDCFTPWGSPGVCKNIKQCEPMLGLLKRRPLSEEALNVLKSAQCGFEGMDPKVCCRLQRNASAVVVTPGSADRLQTASSTPRIDVVNSHPNLRLLDDEICGPIAEDRIFGGSRAAVFEFPWMALLAYDIGKRRPEFRCGASLINRRYLLTAAHCVTSLPSNLRLISARIGDLDLSTDRDCDLAESSHKINCADKHEDVGIERVHVHPEFSREKLHNDIALIRMRRDVEFRSRNIRPICLPIGPAAILKSKKVTVTGWGATENSTRSSELLKVELPVVDITKCARAYQSTSIRIWHKHLCAGGSNKMDSCSGDSGGPLQALSFVQGSPKVIQYGVVSFGPQSCGVEGLPGVYTRVAYYIRWILDTIYE
ncbi:melanization protease 1-like [Orussus abietinus]|uniref:melanization protease 1-like n=1 Tax=Orussus abietinus TaxID=222816 RepID=UPI000626EB54|nr:melanization protease 1-like [Orussus abietinus]